MRAVLLLVAVLVFANHAAGESLFNPLPRKAYISAIGLF
jgi:hypothetical protein